MDSHSIHPARRSGLPRPSAISERSRLPTPSTPRKPLRTNDPLIHAQSTRQTIERGDTHSNNVAPAAGADISISKASESLSRRRPRPSLSDRTVLSLSQIAPSPSPGRRRSSFFSTQSAAPSPSKPCSSLSRSRPSTSTGHYSQMETGIPTPRPASPIKRQLAPTAGNSAPVKSSVIHKKSSIAHLPAQHGTNGSHNATRNLQATSNIRSARTHDSSAFQPRSERVKTSDLNTRPNKLASSSKSTLGATMVSSMPRHGLKTEAQSADDMQKLRSKPITSTPESRDAKSNKLSRGSPPVRTSAALRETIAKAKAAHRAAKHLPNQMHDNHVSSQRASDVQEASEWDAPGLRSRIMAARISGKLNIAAMSLQELPHEIKGMYDLDNIEGGSWAESVDLSKVVAADNEIQDLNETFFSDDGNGNVFGGLETLDLHGNRLNCLPPIMQNLRQLTVLHLSRNHLTNECLSTLGTLQSLRDVRLAENKFIGALDLALLDATSLEYLDISKNDITALHAFGALRSLKSLDASGNRLKALGEGMLESQTLQKLDLSRNSLAGQILLDAIGQSSLLKVIDLSHNAITNIATSNSIGWSMLEFLNVSENRLTHLPDMRNCSGLVTLSADGCRLASIPDGLTDLPELKHVSLARNDIRHIDIRVGSMKNLSVLNIKNNPLRERRFLNMNTEDLKQDLRNRLEEDSAQPEQDIAGPTVVTEPDSELPAWKLQAGAILDKSSCKLEDLDPARLQDLSHSEVKTINLSRNILTDIPRALAIFGHTLINLDLSHNKYAGKSYLDKVLSFPSLRKLNLAFNTISTLQPILDHFDAPSLSELDLTRNRITILPTMRQTFPVLTTLLVADNCITEMWARNIMGLHVVDISSNELMTLDPKIGLLKDHGLRSLLVGANRFRVPRRDIVQKGTEAILTWLRGRISEDCIDL